MKEMSFSVANEATILATVQEIMSFYNFNLYASAWGNQTQTKEAIRNDLVAGQSSARRDSGSLPHDERSLGLR